MILDKKEVNKKRQIEIDLAKGFALILLIICHVGLYLGDPADKALYVFSDIIGSEPIAPIFMVAMGIGIVYTKHNSAKDLFERGIKLLICAYLLNFVRTIIPLLIFGNIDEWTTIASFFVVDILQFSGLTFLFLSLLKKLKIPSYGVLSISLLMVFIAQLYLSMGNALISNTYLIYFVNLFLPVTEWSCFPFFIWFFFPAFGICFGKILIRCKDKNRLYKILLPITFCAFVYVYYKFYTLYPNYTNYYYGGNYYYMGLKNVLVLSLYILFILSLWHFLNKILPKYITKCLEYLGKNLTTFYIFSWIYISILIHLGAYYNIIYTRVSIIIMMIILTLLCFISTVIVNTIKNVKNNKTINQ